MDRVGPVAVLVAVCAVGGCAAAEKTRDQGSPSSSATVTPTNDPVASDAATTLGPLLESGFPDTYAGLRIDGDKVFVYRLPDKALDDAARAAANGARLELVDAKFSLSRLNQVVQQINDDGPYWQSQGVRISTWGPAVDGSAVNVTTVDGSEADRTALAAKYGTDIIRVSQGDFPVPATK